MEPSEVWPLLSPEEQEEWSYLTSTARFSPRPRELFREKCAEHDVDPNEMRRYITAASEAS